MNHTTADTTVLHVVVLVPAALVLLPPLPLVLHGVQATANAGQHVCTRLAVKHTAPAWR